MLSFMWDEWSSALLCSFHFNLICFLIWEITFMFSCKVHFTPPSSSLQCRYTTMAHKYSPDSQTAMLHSHTHNKYISKQININVICGISCLKHSYHSVDIHSSRFRNLQGFAPIQPQENQWGPTLMLADQVWFTVRGVGWGWGQSSSSTAN